MYKQAKDLLPGEIFVSTAGDQLAVEKIETLPWLGIDRTHPKVRIYFETERGHHMYQPYRADRLVEVVGELILCASCQAPNDSNNLESKYCSECRRDRDLSAAESREDESA
jgi:hypothetical protein